MIGIPQNLATYNGLTSALAYFRQILGQNYSRSSSLLHIVLVALITIEVVLIFASAALRNENMGHVGAKLVGLTVWIAFVRSFQTLAPAFIRSMAIAGMSAGGMPGKFSLLEDPSHLIELGATLTQPFLALVDKLPPWHVDKIIYLWVYIIIMLAYVFMAWNIFMAVFEYYLFVAVGVVLVPFGVSPQLRFIAERAINMVVACGIKLLVLACILAMGEPLFKALKFTTTDHIRWNEVWSILCTCGLFAYMVIRAPNLAVSMISGSPTMNGNALVMTIGSAVVGAVGGALTVAGAAIGPVAAGAGAALGWAGSKVKSTGDAVLGATAAATQVPPPPRFGKRKG